MCSWWTVPCSIVFCPFLSFVSSCVFKSIFSDMIMATSFMLPFAWAILLRHLILNLCLDMKSLLGLVCMWVLYFNPLCIFYRCIQHLEWFLTDEDLVLVCYLFYSVYPIPHPPFFFFLSFCLPFEFDHFSMICFNQLPLFWCFESLV